MAKFEVGEYYRNGDVVFRVERRTDKSIVINTHHMDPREAFTFYKRVKVDSEGNEYIKIDNGKAVISSAIRADKYQFMAYIHKNFGGAVRH